MPKLQQRLEAGEPLPDYLKNHPVYYAGPAKKPEGMPSGSFGPTTAGRMDGYVDHFQSAGGSMVMIAKGNRGQQVTDACPQIRGLLFGKHRRARRHFGQREHPQGGGRRIPGAWNGSDLED